MFIFLLLLTLHQSIFSFTITASYFNQHYSAQNPLLLTENTIIQMDESIIITTTAPLFDIQNQQESIHLMFSQSGTKAFQVIVQRNAAFNLKNFTKSNQKIIFENTDLNTQNKSTILLAGAHLVFKSGGTIVLSD